jgi:hypothetical protein
VVGGGVAVAVTVAVHRAGVSFSGLELVMVTLKTVPFEFVTVPEVEFPAVPLPLTVTEPDAACWPVLSVIVTVFVFVSVTEQLYVMVQRLFESGPV